MKKTLSIILSIVLMLTILPTGLFSITASATSTSHAYDNDCDTDCNICGNTRSTNHLYDNDNDTKCNICGYQSTKYTITYYGNGVSGAPTSQTGFTDTPITLKSMSSNSYVFLGWATTPYGEIVYRGGSSYKLSQDISLYAQWGNHCYYCDDKGYTTKGEYKKVKCTRCNSFSLVETYYWHCEICNSTRVTQKNGCMDCGSNRITKYIDCPDCLDGYQNEWVTTNVMCSECSGRGYHKTAQVNAPQPELKAKTTTSVTLVAFEGVDYSLNGETWQESNVFNNLKPGTKYTFYMRYRANSIHTIGNAGKSLTITTNCSKHTYANSCDTTCNVCNAKRTVTHNRKLYTTAATLTKDGKAVKKCTVCGSISSQRVIKKIKSITLTTSTYLYNGKVRTPGVKVTDSAGKAVASKYYTVTYASGRKNVGTYQVTIKFKGEYSGSKTVTFTIVPPKTTVSKLTAGKKSITVAITKKSTQVTGYQIQYSTSKTFSKATTKTISSYKSTKYTLKSLSAKKTYYVRVRTYKTVGKTKYYSGWSTCKYVKTK